MSGGWSIQGLIDEYYKELDEAHENGKVWVSNIFSLHEWDMDATVLRVLGETSLHRILGGNLLLVECVVGDEKMAWGLMLRESVGAHTLTVLNFGNFMVFMEACKRSCDSK